LLGIWAVCSGLLAFFADNPAGTPVTASGIVHLILAVIAFTAIVVGTILVSASLLADPGWRPAARILLALAIAGALGYLLLGTGHKYQHAPGGLYERIFLGLVLAWMAAAAVAVNRATRDGLAGIHALVRGRDAGGLRRLGPGRLQLSICRWAHRYE
jgi:hypothetical protein